MIELEQTAQPLTENDHAFNLADVVGGRDELVVELTD
jgi:hypothetical protein